MSKNNEKKRIFDCERTAFESELLVFRKKYAKNTFVRCRKFKPAG